MLDQVHRFLTHTAQRGKPHPEESARLSRLLYTLAAQRMTGLFQRGVPIENLDTQALAEYLEFVAMLEPQIPGLLAGLKDQLRIRRDAMMAAQSKHRQAADGAKGENPRAETWDAIEIRFLGDHTVQIKVGHRMYSQNYAEMGFEDRRGGRPNRQWAVLQTLACLSGTIPDDARNGKQWEAIAKSIERTRKLLHKHFRLSGDPLPYSKGVGYQARFKIHPPPTAVK